jgi:short-subunit dehydrogenase
MEWEDFDIVLSVNLMAAVHLTRLLLPQLIKNRGFIVNVASGSGLAPFPGLSAYTTSKFGLVGFSEAIRAELRGLVGVSTICPAFVATPIIKDSLLSSKMESREQTERRDKLHTLFQNIGMAPDRVADVIIKSIKKNKGLVPVGFVTHFLYALRRFLPKTFDRINASSYRSFVRKGLLK